MYIGRKLPPQASGVREKIVGVIEFFRGDVAHSFRVDPQRHQRSPAQIESRIRWTIAVSDDRLSFTKANGGRFRTETVSAATQCVTPPGSALR